MRLHGKGGEERERERLHCTRLKIPIGKEKGGDQTFFSHHSCPISSRSATLAVTGTAAMGWDGEGRVETAGAERGRHIGGQREGAPHSPPSCYPAPTLGCLSSS